MLFAKSPKSLKKVWSCRIVATTQLQTSQSDIADFYDRDFLLLFSTLTRQWGHQKETAEDEGCVLTEGLAEGTWVHTAMLAKDDPNSPTTTGNCVLTFCLLV